MLRPPDRKDRQSYDDTSTLFPPAAQSTRVSSTSSLSAPCPGFMFELPLHRFTPVSRADFPIPPQHHSTVRHPQTSPPPSPLAPSSLSSHARQPKPRHHATTVLSLQFWNWLGEHRMVLGCIQRRITVAKSLLAAAAPPSEATQTDSIPNAASPLCNSCFFSVVYIAGASLATAALASRNCPTQKSEVLFAAAAAGEPPMGWQ